MKWRVSNRAHVAVSECGNYEVRLSTDRKRGDFYNAWHVPSRKHIAASHHKKEVLAAVGEHAAKTTPPSTSAHIAQASAECSGNAAGGST